MTNTATLFGFAIAMLAGVETATAQSICATRKDPEDCWRAFRIPDGERPDTVVVGRIENDRWRFDYLPVTLAAKARPPVCSYRGDLTLSQGSHVEIWLIAERGIHQWLVPSLAVDQTALAGSYAPVAIDTSKAGTFPSVPDAKKRRTPSVRVLEPGGYATWARKAIGRACGPKA